MAYDADRDRIVLFGGNLPLRNDTWEWDGTTWRQIMVAGPPARYNHRMAFVPERHAVVVFGGIGRDEQFNPIRLGDTWEWDGTAWTRLDIPGPVPRSSCSMTTDTGRHEVVLYGGAGASGGMLVYFSDTWTFRPHRTADFNADGVIDSADFFAFLDAFFAHDQAADFNCDGTINSQDFFDFLARFFEG